MNTVKASQENINSLKELLKWVEDMPTCLYDVMGDAYMETVQEAQLEFIDFSFLEEPLFLSHLDINLEGDVIAFIDNMDVDDFEYVEYKVVAE
jgi:hypothetical protein